MRTTTVSVEGGALHCRLWGEGPLAVLVHGFGFDHRVWEPVARRLEGRRVAGVDLRGLGRATAPPTPVLTMERLAVDLVEVVGALGGPPADLVGFSMGGFALLALLERHPRDRATVALAGTRSTADSADERAGRDELARVALARGRPEFASAFLPRLTAADPDPLVAARPRQMLEARPYETLVSATRGLQRRPDRTTLLSHVDMPLLISVGAKDAFVPQRLAHDMAARAGDASLSVLSGAGHTTPLEAPVALGGELSPLWARAGRR